MDILTLLSGALPIDETGVDIPYGEREAADATEGVGDTGVIDVTDLGVIGVTDLDVIDVTDLGVTMPDTTEGVGDTRPDVPSSAAEGIPDFLRAALRRADEQASGGAHLPKADGNEISPRRSPCIVTRRRALELGAYAAALALLGAGTLLRPDEDATEEVVVTDDATEAVEVVEAYASVPEEVTEGFQTVTLVDDESGAISVTDVSDSWDYGYDVDVLLINRTDSDALYQVESGYVDGIRCDPTLLTRVSGGQSATSCAYFLGGAYEALGLPFDHVELTLKMCDADSGDTLTSGTANLYPTGLGADEAEDFSYEASDTHVSVLDEGDLAVTVIGHEALTSGGFSLYLLVDNETSEKVYVSLSSASVNGEAADAVCALGTDAGERHLSTITWTADTLGKLGITGEDVTSVGFWLDAKSYEHDDDGNVTGYVSATSTEVEVEVA